MVFLIVPAYNEEQNIGRLVEEARRFLGSQQISYRLLIVDDGSRDRTAEIVHKIPTEFSVGLISYQPNQGVQEAFRRGFQAALAEALDDDVIVTLEADGTADWNILPVFLEKISQGADVVVASYYAKGGAVQGTVWHRKALSRAGNLFIRIFLPIKGIHTYSSFYRAYRPSALRAVHKRYGDFYKETGFSCVVELLYRLHLLKLKITEVPMVLQGTARIGKSKMKVFQTILGYLRISFRGATQSF